MKRQLLKLLKKVISNNATVGFIIGSMEKLCFYAKQMIKKNVRVNNEFYVCPVFNEAIEDGKRLLQTMYQKCMDWEHQKI